MSMDWSNERFVRFFTRDTVTWKRWSWEAKAVWGLLLRKVDRAGVIDTGRDDKSDALALILEVPCEVAARIVPEWLKSGALVESAGGFCVPNFKTAQETSLSDKRRQAESREQKRAANLRNSDDACHEVSHGVTPRHAVSQPVTPDQTRPDQTRPSPDQTLFAGLVETSPPAKAKPVKSVKAKEDKPTDPRHTPLIKALCESFESIRGVAYPFAPRDPSEVSKLLATGTSPEAIARAWSQALRSSGFPKVSTLAELNTHLAHFVGTAPPNVVDIRKPIAPGQFTESRTVENF